MNLQELKAHIDRAVETTTNFKHRSPTEITVAIPVDRIGQLGHTAVVNLQQISQGTDWNANLLLLVPDTTLKEVHLNELTDLYAEHRRVSLSIHDATALTRENKALKATIARLQACLIKANQ